MIQQNYFKTKKVQIGFIFFILHFSISSLAQDTLKSISISFNILQACINERTVYMEYKPFRHHTFGVSIGHIYYNPAFEVFVLSPSQNDFPGTVYNGTVYRINYSYVLENKRKYESYVGAQLIYRDMYYNNQYFTDGAREYVEYWRNEKANVFGFDFVYGRNRYLRLNKYCALLFNTFYGVGWRERHRTIDTYDIKWNGGSGSKPTDPPQLGNETKTQKYLVPVFGLKLGFQFHI